MVKHISAYHPKTTVNAPSKPKGATTNKAGKPFTKSSTKGGKK